MGGKRYNNLRYSDDTALLAGNEKGLPLICKINEIGKQFGLKIKIMKTKALVVSKNDIHPK